MATPVVSKKVYQDAIFHPSGTENSGSDVPAPSLETRRATANVFAANMDALFPSQPSVASPAVLTPARVIQVQPKSHDIRQLDAKIEEEINCLRSLSLAENLLICGDIPRRLTDSLATTQHHIDVVEDAMSTLSLDPGSSSLQQLAVCKELFAIVAKNINVINNNLRLLIHSKEKPPVMSFRAGFGSIAYTIASNPINSDSAIQKGAFGSTSLVVHENGTRYVVKRPLGDDDLLQAYPYDLSSSEEEDYLRERKDENSLDLAAETTMNYYLPKDSGVVDFFGVTKEGHSLLGYVSGGELFDAILNDRLTTMQLYKIAKSLAKTVALLHREHIIHRDLKPENILLGEGLQPKIIDFGLATLRFKDIDFSKRIGSRDYMAPEMLARGQPKNKEVDVWSLGCVIYVALCGESFYGDLLKVYRKNIEDYSSEAALNKFLSNPVNNIQKGVLSTIRNLSRNLRLRQEGIIGTQLESVLMSCLKVDPKERASMENVVAIFNGQ